jgi:CRISPR/Cas system CSM-associated protein Csm3 (group 7 of RAMP superfamily)
MATLQYKIEFTSFWHTGSGLSSGTESDLVVIKDKNGRPFIPGKTLKGLLREAAEIIHGLKSNLVTKDFIDEVFGERSDEGKSGENNLHPPIEARSFFSDAYLSEQMRLYFNKQLNYKELLYKNIASTKIDENGQAENHSLRKIEVTIPLDLYAEIIDFPEVYQNQMEYCFAWVKKIGINRTRGLGRCSLLTLNVG